MTAPVFSPSLSITSLHPLFFMPGSPSHENPTNSFTVMLDEPKFHFQHFVNEGGEGRADVRCSLDSFIEASKWTSFFNSPVHSCDDDDDDSSDDSDEDVDDKVDDDDQPSGDSGVGSSYSGEFFSNISADRESKIYPRMLDPITKSSIVLTGGDGKSRPGGR